MNYRIEVQWDASEQMFFAAFVRDDRVWFLDGACTGSGVCPSDAVLDLIGIAEYLVINGQNFLTGGEISIEDRKWLHSMLDQGNDITSQEIMYLAIRQTESE
jgi:hypothetical protein